MMGSCSRISLFLTVLFLSAPTSPVAAEEQVILRDGRTVILYDDGTWKAVQNRVSSGSDYRSVLWGTNRATAISSEGSKPDLDRDDFLAFRSTIAGIDCLIAYYYVDDRLVRGRYAFQADHMNKNDYLDDYNNVKSLLDGKYGKSKDAGQIWKDPKSYWKDKPTYWGSRVAFGEVSFYATWETSTTRIYLSLSGRDYDTVQMVEYYSKDLEHLESSKEKEQF